MPERIEFKFNRRFSGKSRNGVAFAWIKKTYADRADDALIAAASAFYYPIALYQSGAPKAEVEAAIAQSRLLLETHFAAALGDYAPLDGVAETDSSPEEPVPAIIAVSNGQRAAVFPAIDQDRIFED